MRKIVLAAAALVHVVLLLAWRPSMVAKPGDVGHETAVYLLAPPPPAPRRAPAQALAPVRHPRPPAPAARVEPVAAPTAPEPLPITPAQPPEALVNTDVPTAASLRENSRKLAGAVDQQLRKEQKARELVVKPEADLTERFKEIYNDYSDVPSHARTASGDRLDRVEGPFGRYCVRTTGNGPGGGRDPFKDAGKQMVVNCPERGPLSDYFVGRRKKSGQ